jgi:hypothetical protein
MLLEKLRSKNDRSRGFLGRNLLTLAVAALVALVVGGSAYAAGKIDGNSIKSGSIAAAKLTKGARAQLSEAGPQGPIGATGPRGEKGSTGSRGETGAKGDTGARGEVGEVGATGPDEHNYGVVSTFLDGVQQPPLWTATIPPDGNNAAGASGTTVISCAVGPCQLTVRGVIRSDDPGYTGQGGGGLVITNAANGQLVAAGQTEKNPAFHETSVVPVDTVSLESLAPSSLTGTEIPIKWVVGGAQLASGAYLLHGTIQFFDFN